MCVRDSVTQSRSLGSLCPPIPAQVGLKEMMLPLHVTTTSPDFLFNRTSYHDLHKPTCPPQQRALKATSLASGDRMSLLSRHLASPT